MFKTLNQLYHGSFCVTVITPNPGRSFLGWLASMVALMPCCHGLCRFCVLKLT